MVIVWLVYILSLLIFLVIGWTGVFHAKKYGIPGDLTKKAAVIYIILMTMVIVLTISVVLNNGADAPLNLNNLKFYFFK